MGRGGGVTWFSGETGENQSSLSGNCQLSFIGNVECGNS